MNSRHDGNQLFHPRHLIRIDGTAGLVAGVTMLVLHGWLAELYQLPRWLLISNACGNLLYGTYSTILASRPRRRLFPITVLVIANLTWAFVCIFVVAIFANTATLLGLGHFVLESLFVGGLGVLEWRFRNVLRTDLPLPKKRHGDTESAT